MGLMWMKKNGSFEKLYDFVYHIWLSDVFIIFIIFKHNFNEFCKKLPLMISMISLECGKFDKLIYENLL